MNWFSLENDEYIELEPDAQGIIKSKIFPGLWMDIKALVTGNMQQLMKVLQTGLNSPEYQNFIQQLTAK